MDWEAAERRACDWLRVNGFEDAALTARGADGGIDIISSRLVAQVKAHSAPIGRPPIQAIYGIAAASGRQAAVFSVSGYSSQAVNWATSNGVALFRLDGGRVEAANPVATHFSNDDSGHGSASFRHRADLTVREQRRALTAFASGLGTRLRRSESHAVVRVLAKAEELHLVTRASRGFHSSGPSLVTDSRLILLEQSGRARWWSVGAIYRPTISGRTLSFVCDGRRERLILQSSRTARDVLRRRLGVEAASDDLEPLPRKVRAVPSPRAMSEPQPERPAPLALAASRGSSVARRLESRATSWWRSTGSDVAQRVGGGLRATMRAIRRRTGGRSWLVKLAAVGVGLLAGTLVAGVAEAIWGPWDRGQLPGAVAAASLLAWVVAGVGFWMFRTRKSQTQGATGQGWSPPRADGGRSDR